MSKEFLIHVICNGKVFIELVANHIPRIDDEVRIENKIYKVTKVVWCFDEVLSSGMSRVNMAVTEVEL